MSRWIIIIWNLDFTTQRIPIDYQIGVTYGRVNFDSMRNIKTPATFALLTISNFNINLEYSVILHSNIHAYASTLPQKTFPHDKRSCSTENAYVPFHYLFLSSTFHSEYAVHKIRISKALLELFPRVLFSNSFIHTLECLNVAVECWNGSYDNHNAQCSYARSIRTQTHTVWRTTDNE